MRRMKSGLIPGLKVLYHTHRPIVRFQKLTEAQLRSIHMNLMIFCDFSGFLASYLTDLDKLAKISDATSKSRFLTQLAVALTSSGSMNLLLHVSSALSGMRVIVLAGGQTFALSTRMQD